MERLKSCKNALHMQDDYFPVAISIIFETIGPGTWSSWQIGPTSSDLPTLLETIRDGLLGANESLTTNVSTFLSRWSFMF